MKQMMFYAMTEAETFDPDISLRSLTDIKTKGFDSIYLEYRNTRAKRNSTRCRAAVERICKEATRLGLAVALDSSPYGWHADMQSEHPELFTDKLSHLYVPIQNGRFVLEISHSDPSVQAIENAWLITPDGDVWQAVEVGARCRVLSQVSEGGGCAMTRKRGGAITRQTWAIDGMADGKLLVVVRSRFAYENRDLGHPAHGFYLDQICNSAAQLDLAGMVWDEPHFGFNFLEDAYPISDRLYEVFAKRFDYDLRTRLVDFWLDVAGRDSGQVRLDFAELLESQLALLECDFKRRVLTHPGLGGHKPNFFVGIHRTMHEELSDDFRIGSIDYFRHNRGLTAGCTDSIFEREDSMVTFNLLARALAPLSESGEAWNNSWGFLPTAEHLDYYLRLSGCLGVRWIGHAYHGSMLFGPGYPHHPTWERMSERLAIHRELLDRLEGATPACDTAIVYHWRGLADFPGNYHHQHRRDLMMACLELCAAQASLTIIDPSQIGTGSFRRLLVLWPDRLEPTAWDALETAAATGVEILLVGPPAWKSNAGTEMSERWARLTGCRLPERSDAIRIPYGTTLDIEDESFVLDPAIAVPNWQSNPENTYPDHAKAWHLSGATPVAFHQGVAIGIRNGNVTTVTTELPQFPGALLALWPVKTIAPPGFLAFPYSRGTERLLALCARKAEPISAEFIWQETTITLHNCRHAVLHCNEDGLVTAGGENTGISCP